jgi:hypothetical protein
MIRVSGHSSLSPFSAHISDWDCSREFNEGWLLATFYPPTTAIGLYDESRLATAFLIVFALQRHDGWLVRGELDQSRTRLVRVAFPNSIIYVCAGTSSRYLRISRC